MPSAWQVFSARPGPKELSIGRPVLRTDPTGGHRPQVAHEARNHAADRCRHPGRWSRRATRCQRLSRRKLPAGCVFVIPMSGRTNAAVVRWRRTGPPGSASPTVRACSAAAKKFSRSALGAVHVTGFARLLVETGQTCGIGEVRRLHMPQARRLVWPWTVCETQVPQPAVSGFHSEGVQIPILGGGEA